MSKLHNLSTYGVQDTGDLAILTEIRHIGDLATQFQRINRNNPFMPQIKHFILLYGVLLLTRGSTDRQISFSPLVAVRGITTWL